MAIKSFDAFAGVGGFTQALENCGIETIGFSEIDKYANAVLKYQYPNIPNYGDITTLDPKKLPDFDLFTFGSPCQDFSIAGKREGIGGARSGLFLKALEIIEEKKPRYFLFENVKGMLSSNKGWDMARAFIEMEQAGYSLWWQVLNAKDFGVPQNRERIFIFGSRSSSPREILFERGEVEEHPKTCLDASCEAEAHSVATRHLNRNGGLKQHHSSAVQVAETPHAITRGRSTAPWKRGEVAPSRRLGDKDDIKVVSDARIRRLTPVETERLMGWPDGWTSMGNFGDDIKWHKDKDSFMSSLEAGEDEGDDIRQISDTQRYKMCGNGVVSNCVEAIIREMIRKNPN